MKIVITGAEGMLGWHSRCFFKTIDDVEVFPVNKSCFNKDECLKDALQNADVVLHFAGISCGAEEHVRKTNIEITQRLVDMLQYCNSTPHVIFSSSTHIDRNTGYGQAKREAMRILDAWAANNNCKSCSVVLPHVYGEYGKPFYNSVVSTFCYQIANGDMPTIYNNSQVEIIHSQAVADLVWYIINKGIEGEFRAHGYPITVEKLLEKLLHIDKSYRAGIIPDFSNITDLELFNTYRSYLFEAADFYPKSLTFHSDDRGNLFEAVKTNHGGQCFISTTRPGITRGDHYHRRKVERFLVINGEATISIRKLFSDQIKSFHVRGDMPVYIDMPTLHTHNITNTGESDLLTLFWSHEIFDPGNPDTYAERV